MRNALAAAVLLLAACDYDPGGRCASDAECLEGQVCGSGVCTPGQPVPPGHPPVAAPDAYTVPASRVLDCPVLANDSDPDGDPLTAEKVTAPAHGVVFRSQDARGFVYAAFAGYSGPDAFTYRASDGVLRSDAVTVTLTVP